MSRGRRRVAAGVSTEQRITERDGVGREEPWPPDMFDLLLNTKTEFSTTRHGVYTPSGQYCPMGPAQRPSCQLATETSKIRYVFTCPWRYAWHLEVAATTTLSRLPWNFCFRNSHYSVFQLSFCSHLVIISVSYASIDWIWPFFLTMLYWFLIMRW